MAIEVISAGNSPGEMRRKLRDYFKAGTRLVWFVTPKTRTAEVHSSPRRPKTLTEADSLHGEIVLPGFELSLRTLFARCRAKLR